MIYSRMKKNSSTRHKDIASTVLVVIVIMFLITNIPRGVLSASDIFYHVNEQGISSKCGCNLSPIWYSVTTSVNHLLLTTNSSCNVLNYWYVCPLFKTSLTCLSKTRCCSPRHTGEQEDNTMTSCLELSKTFCVTRTQQQTCDR